MIEIIKCSLPHFWYANKIGQRFEVITESESSYMVRHSVYSHFGLYIAKEDAKIQ